MTDYFSIDQNVSLDKLPAAAKIHVIGTAGVAMAQLAVLLAERGYRVSGSDKRFYEPMGSLLRRSPVRICEGYSADNLTADLDLVVIGNVASRSHPEVQQVQKLGLPYTIFPELLYELLIKGRHSVVCAGTHGKTTTSALAATLFEKLGRKPSWFIGGAVNELPESLHAGDGQISVVEGDEYDSAFFAKVPKFTFYKPDTLIVTSVEYDHADIYSSLEQINAEFTKLVMGMPAGGTAICCLDDSNLADLAAEWAGRSACRVVTYGHSAQADYRIVKSEQQGRLREVQVESKTQGNFKFSLPLPGAHNARNALAVVIAALGAGASLDDIKAGLLSFQGVKRRQQVRLDRDGLIVIEDFAHHPTAVQETISAVREAYPDRRVWAIFEPRSTTSRRKVFQDDYVRAFKGAHRVVLSQVESLGGEAESELLDVATLAEKVQEAGTTAVCLPGAESIFELVKKEAKAGDLLLVMSNGAFGGLIDLLISGL